MRNISLDISALNPEFKAHAGRGLGTYVRKLREFFDSCEDPDLKPQYFSQPEILDRNALYSLSKYVPIGKVSIQQQLILPFSLSKATKQSKFIHFPAHIDAPAWCPKPYIVTVPDLIPLIFKDLYQADKASWRFHLARWLENSAVKNARSVIAISEASARDVESVLDIPAERIFVTPLGVDESFFRDDSPNLSKKDLCQLFDVPTDRPVVLYLGGIDQRKNISGLLNSFKKLSETCEEKGKQKPLLFMAGRIFEDEQYPKLLTLIEKLDLRNDVRCHGFVKNEDLHKLFKLSSVFCFLSLYEGFGLPVLEAFAAGLPVVCSNTSSLPEVAGDAALLVDPDDSEKAAELMYEVIDNSELANSLRGKGLKRAKLFTWEQTGKKTLEVYQRLLKNA